jgi:hypothetical protein
MFREGLFIQAIGVGSNHVGKKHLSLWLKQNHEEDTPLPSRYSLVQQW